MTDTSFTSRWGYHPCHYELFRKLKSLHRWYWQSLYDFHRWHRWWRKDEQNRTGAEPAVCPLFLLSETRIRPVSRGGDEGFKVFPKTVTDHGILELYHLTRMPQPEPCGAFGEETMARVESLHEKVAEFFNE